MSEKYEELLGVMDTLIHNHRRLLEVEQEKPETVIQQNWRGLEQLVSKSEKIIGDIESVERRRLELIGEMGGNEKATLRTIAYQVPEKTREELLKSGERLMSLMHELKELNKYLEKLVQSSLEIVNYSISLFSGRGGNTKTYSDGGQEKSIEEKHTSFVFDVEA